jgi:hypothetical protein
LFIAITVLPALAQETIYENQAKLIRSPNSVTRLGDDLFGDKVNLYTGALEFVQTDVSLPGNSSLPISVGRRLVVGQAPINGTLLGSRNSPPARHICGKDWLGYGPRAIDLRSLHVVRSITDGQRLE